MADFIVTTLADELDSTNPNATLADFGGAGNLSLREALFSPMRRPAPTPSPSPQASPGRRSP